MDTLLLPTSFFLVTLSIVWLALGTTRQAHIARLFTTIATFFSISFFLGIALHYTSLPFYLDHVEPAVAAIGHISLQNGQELFSPKDAATCYNLPYGPALYLINAIPIALFGPSIVASKIAGVTALIGACTLFWLSLKIRGSTGQYAFICVLTLLAAIMTNDDEAYWNRPEPFLLFSTALGLYALARAKYCRRDMLTLAFAIAIAVDLKPHALLYFLPLLRLAHLKFGNKNLFACIILIPILTITPFLLPQISLINYINILKGTSHHALIAALLQDNLFFLATSTAPLLLLTAMHQIPPNSPSKKGWIDVILLMLAGLLTAIIGAKAGAGRHHLWPFVLITLSFTLTHWQALHTNRLANIIKACLLSMIALGVARSMGIQLGMYEYMQDTMQKQFAAAREVSDFIHHSKDLSIEMGYGSQENYPTTFVRPLLVYAGYYYRMDAAALMDMEYYGVDLMHIWEKNFKQCQPRQWIIPVGEGDIFDIANAYGESLPDMHQEKSTRAQQQLFSNVFRSTFKKHYIKIHHGQIFDIYQCQIN